MNRTGLAAAVAVGAVVGVVFGVYPRLDLDLAALFYDPHGHAWTVAGAPWMPYARDAARLITTVIVAPAVFAVLGKLILPRARMLIGGRAALFLLLTLALGPGVLANTLLKDHWGRPRPRAVTVFGGTERFRAWWDPRGDCPANCSFVAGEPSGAFWTLAPATLAPPQWRPLAYAGTLAFGAGVGVLRMAGGGHFFSDVVFAGVFMFLLIFAFHGLIYRWPRTRLTDKAVERMLSWPGEALLKAFAARARARRGGGTT